MPTCHRCGDFILYQTHSCKAFSVRHPEKDGDYETTIWALSDESAAEKYAVAYNEHSAEYSMMGGDPRIHVFVDGKPFTVEAAAVIEYMVIQGH